jgi:hypothetical protein
MRIEPPVYERLKLARKLAEIPEGPVNFSGSEGSAQAGHPFFETSS